MESRQIPLISEPQQEQDVIALFHELLAGRIIRGFEILCTNAHEQYDSLFYANYRDEELEYSPDNPLGVSPSLIGKKSAPLVL